MNRLTSAIYWASLDPIIQKLRTMQNIDERAAYARSLVPRGYIVDRPIQVDQEMNPEDYMLVRQNNGFTWVPSAGQNPLPTMPGADLPNLPAYDPNNPPAKSIKVSIDAADYPPFPGTPPLVIPKPVVGEGIQTASGEVFLAGPGANMSTLSEGETVEQNGIKYVAHYNAARNPPVTFSRV